MTPRPPKKPLLPPSPLALPASLPSALADEDDHTLPCPGPGPGPAKNRTDPSAIKSHNMSAPVPIVPARRKPSRSYTYTSPPVSPDSVLPGGAARRLASTTPPDTRRADVYMSARTDGPRGGGPGRGNEALDERLDARLDGRVRTRSDQLVAGEQDARNPTRATAEPSIRAYTPPAVGPDTARPQPEPDHLPAFKSVAVPAGTHEGASGLARPERWREWDENLEEIRSS